MKFSRDWIWWLLVGIVHIFHLAMSDDEISIVYAW
jgi:hypothetical protein